MKSSRVSLIDLMHLAELQSVMQYNGIGRCFKTIHVIFLRTKANVQTALDQANLLSNVRNDIETYKTSRSSTTDALLSERNHIDSSHRMADDLLTHAHETRAEFSRQRTQLGSIQTRMSNVLSNFPGMNNIIGMIQTRRRRDAIIMGCLIGLLIILLWTYMSR